MLKKVIIYCSSNFLSCFIGSVKLFFSVTQTCAIIIWNIISFIYLCIFILSVSDILWYSFNTFLSFNFSDMISTLNTFKPDESLKKFKCSYCPYSTKVSSHLKCHKRIHTGEKPFKCEICGKAFSQKSTLVNHYLSHTGERPFSCDYCKKDFVRKSNLRNHKCPLLQTL